MRLVRIKLSGFKSFSDSVTINLPGRRVGVVGPNGCGKSNLIDAVRWVLGESSAKQLRGEHMQDVIFNGASGRRPAARASVELVFDNSSGSLQGEWGRYSEIAVKRQLNRQGESGYFINGQTVRRRDITDLFLGTGAGARGYAVIEQGMIARIIEARPEELRTHIEEAAGIAKYKDRRRDTETRLKDTREHLQRLDDLQSEIVRQLDKLTVQADAAARHQSLTQERARLHNLLDFLQWQYALADADKAEQRRRDAEAEQQQAEQHGQSLSEQLEQLHRQEQEQQQHQQSLTREHALLREQTARLEEQIRAGQQQRERTERERENARQRLQQLADETAAVAEALTRTEAAITEHKAEFTISEQQFEEYETALAEYEHQAEQYENAARDSERQHRQTVQETALLAQEWQHARHTLAQHRQRLTQLQDELFRLPENDPAPEFDDCEAQYRESLQQCRLQEQQLEHAGQQLQAAAQHHNRLQQQHLALTARRDTLSALLPPDDFWRDSPHHAAPALHRRLRIDQAWQPAVAAVLAERLNSRLLPDDFQVPQPLPDAAAAWVQTAADTAEVHPQSLLNHIQAEDGFLPALRHWLGDVLCADNLATALARRSELRDRQCWLTPEGHRIDRHSVTLFRAAADPSARLLEHRRVSSELDELAPQLAEAGQQFQHRQNHVREQQNQLKQLQTHQQQLSEQRLAQQRLQAEHAARARHNQIRREQITAEICQLNDGIEELECRTDTLQEQHDRLQDRVRESAAQQQEHEHRCRHARQQLQQRRTALADCERRRHAAELACRQQQQQHAHLLQQQQQLHRQQSHWQQRSRDMLSGSLPSDLAEQQLRLDSLNEHAGRLQDHLHAAEARLHELREHYRQCQAGQQHARSRLPALQQAVQTALLQQQEALLQAKHHHGELTARRADLDALAAQAAGADSPAALKRRLARLAQELDDLGAVNLAALSELAEAREREQYYRSQSEDIRAAAALLEEAVARINGETEARFRSTFQAVNDKIQTIFPTLFGGGEAGLRLTENDWLRGGVTLSARPPGKKNSTIHLLSGGEKALTAMSLVFALFALNPAPFCLLDEVDAPLDDANTARFCELVKQMSAATQFLYISHNRLTMEMAEQLIGVTMQEKGVSRIVAVDVAQAAAMNEAA